MFNVPCFQSPYLVFFFFFLGGGGGATFVPIGVQIFLFEFWGFFFFFCVRFLFFFSRKQSAVSNRVMKRFNIDNYLVYATEHIVPRFHCIKRIIFFCQPPTWHYLRINGSTLSVGRYENCQKILHLATLLSAAEVGSSIGHQRSQSGAHPRSSWRPWTQQQQHAKGPLPCCQWVVFTLVMRRVNYVNQRFDSLHSWLACTEIWVDM